MNNIGQILKEHIESHKLVKGDIAKTADISYNYLSTIFRKTTMDMSLWEKLCLASGLSPAVAFSDAAIQEEKPGTDTAQLKELLAEKERTIQILLRQVELLERIK